MSTLALTLATAVICMPASVRLTPKVLHEAAWKVPAHSILIAQKYAGSDPHGDDPHGDDPHEEQHDDNIRQRRPKSEQGSQRRVRRHCSRHTGSVLATSNWSARRLLLNFRMIECSATVGGFIPSERAFYRSNSCLLQCLFKPDGLTM